MKTGSTVNISGSGGGSIFAYQFLSGIQGSADPLQIPGRYVIVPSADYSVPASEAAAAGCRSARLSICRALKARKAQRRKRPAGRDLHHASRTICLFARSHGHYGYGRQCYTRHGEVSADGFPIVAGYFTTAGTSIRPSLMQAFEVQPASYVFKQGTFNTTSFVAGNGGSVAINGNTTVLDGNILPSALPGYTGRFHLFKRDQRLHPGVNRSTALRFQLRYTGFGCAGHCRNAPGCSQFPVGKRLSGNQHRKLGHQLDHNGAGAVLNAASVVLTAQSNIWLQSGAQIIAVDSTGTGSASLITPTGTLTMDQNSLVHASDLVNDDHRPLELPGRPADRSRHA